MLLSRGTISLSPDNSWTNATFEAAFCAQALLQGFEVYVNIDAAPNGARFMLPRCFFGDVFTIIISMDVSNVIIPNQNASSTIMDPLSNLPSSLTSLILRNVVLLNSTNGAHIGTPDWDSIFTRLPLLRTFYISNSNINGPLPPLLPSTMVQFSAPNNGLTGTIPATLISRWESTGPGSNFVIHLSNNSLTGTIPSALVGSSATPSMTSISINLSANKLTGTIPATLLNVAQLASATSISLNLAANQLTGTIPQLVSDYASQLSSVSINLSSNRLNGTVSANILKIDSSFYLNSLSFDASSNRLTGSVPRFLATVGVYNIFGNPLVINSVNINLANNLLSGSLPIALGPEWATMTIMRWNLDSNSISGTIPNGIATDYIRNITYFYFSANKNQLSGVLPPYLVRSSANLLTLSFSVSSNKLSGSIPTTFLKGIGYTISTLTLDMSFNGLSGSIPVAFLEPFTTVVASGRNYLNLNLANNRLTGALPWNILGNLYSLTVNIDSNSIGGFFPWDDLLVNASSIRATLVNVSAVNNNFGGELVFPALTYSSFNVYLNLHGNSLRRLVADTSVPYLRALDVANNNNLKGRLPSGFLQVGSRLNDLRAYRTGLTGAFPSISGVVNSGLINLDLSYTSIDFCSAIVAPWASQNLVDCFLTGTNVDNCEGLYPDVCFYGAGRSNTVSSASGVAFSSALLFTALAISMILL